MVDCAVQVNYESVPTSSKELLVNFESDVRNYVNNYQWGEGDPDEKISCTLNIFVKSVSGENQYVAQVFVGSQRPIYGSDQNTAVLRLLDENWEFTYVKDRPIDHNIYTLSSLGSFLDFYMLLILGYDYDTYELLGGTPYLRKASDIASRGNSAGLGGWVATSGSFSRTKLVNELLSASVEPVRAAMWDYHFNGLDSLAFDRFRGQEAMLRALDVFGATRKKLDPQNLTLRLFFETKNLEIASIFETYPDRSVYIRLSKIDPSHTGIYEERRNAPR
jgi:hypothetical protein